MKSMRAIAMLLGVVLMLADQASTVFSAPHGKPPSPGATYVAGEVLVKFKASSSGTQKQSAVALRNHSVLAELTSSGVMHVKIAAGQTVAEALTAYQNDPNVESVQPNFIYRKSAVPNDTDYDLLWAFKNTGQDVNGTFGTPGADINIEKAWDRITDCSSVVVAVLDSGINYNHVDLAANMWDGGPSFPNHGWDFVDNDNDPIDGDGHGTHVAGTIASRGNNGVGVTGVCWQASIMAVRVLDATGSGTTATIIEGIDFAVTNGAKVINMSLGGGGFDPDFFAAISLAQSNDVVVVVAAGNSTSNVDLFGNAVYPCSFTHANLICVAALAQNYLRSSFTNFGVFSVDVGAPGSNIRSLLGVQTASTITDDFNNAGALDWMNPSGRWAYSAAPTHVVANSATYPAGAYVNSADDRLYKTFDLSASGNVAALMHYSVEHTLLSAGDFLNVNYRAAGGDPFGAGGVNVDLHFGDVPAIHAVSVDISPCRSATCALGFQLSTDATDTAQGVRIRSFSIDLIQASNTTYVTFSGTSMATPLVAGLATMLRAYNPQFTYVEVVNAIKNGGRSISALNGLTTTGRAIDVMSSLAYINPPTGLAASVVR